MAKDSKIAKIIVDAQGQNLKGNIVFSNMDIIPINDVAALNAVLRSVYEKEGKKFADLINEDRIIINSSKVWDKFELYDNQYFVKVDKKMTRGVPEPEKEEKKEEPKKEEEKKEEPKKEEEKKEEPKKEEEKKEEPKKEEEKKEEPKKEEEKKKRVLFKRTKKTEEKKEKSKIKLRTVVKRTIAGLIGVGFVLLGIDAIRNRLNKNSDTTSYDNNNDNYRVDINEDGRVYTYNTTDEEAMSNIQNNYYQGRNAELGSCIEEDDMVTQLDVIDDSVVQNKSFSFERLVISDDYDAIYVLNNLRNDVINGVRDKHEFMDVMVNYVFKGENYVDGNFLERYNDLHPYAQYIVLRMGQAVLANCRDYSNGQYNLGTLTNYYNNMGSELYEYLVQYAKSR